MDDGIRRAVYVRMRVALDIALSIVHFLGFLAGGFLGGHAGLGVC